MNTPDFPNFPKERFKLPDEFFEPERPIDEKTLADLKEPTIPTGGRLVCLVETARAHLQHLNDTLLLIARERNVTIDISVGNTYATVNEPTAPNIDITFLKTL